MALAADGLYRDAPLVPVRDWSCPMHDHPWHDDDDRDDVGCLGCRYGRWVDRLDENGEQVMAPAFTFSDVGALIETLNPSWLGDVLLPGVAAKINWLEDSLDGEA